MTTQLQLVVVVVVVVVVVIMIIKFKYGVENKVIMNATAGGTHRHRCALLQFVVCSSIRSVLGPSCLQRNDMPAADVLQAVASSV